MTAPSPDVAPLITAAEMYPALEALALGARRELLLSFRICDADTRLRSDAARDLGLSDWADLLRHVAGTGVEVRLLQADFDPIFATDLHCGAWRSAERFAKGAPGTLSVMTALHGAKVGPVWRRLLWPKIRARLADIARDDTPDTPALRQVRAGKIALWPVSLHQKFAVADGSHAILGGLDVDERRYDTPDHDRPAPDTWHDVSVEVKGPVAADIRAHFADTWRAALRDGAEPMGTSELPQRPQPEQRDKAVRLLRTVSTPRRGAFAFGPKPEVTEHETAFEDLIARAERYLYIETQFLRHWPLAEALARAAADKPDLQLIMVVPPEPERIVFGGDDGIDARHAQALQLRCVRHIRRAFGDRVALATLGKPERGTPADGKPLYGAGIVYVHAKVAIADDRIAVVGSANMNGRSMRWDTEASLWIDSPNFARPLMDRLAEIWLGDHFDPQSARRAETWWRLARDQRRRAPDHRSCFLLPYPEDRVRRFSLYAPILPADMF